MGEQIKQTGNEAVERWHKKMPSFFRRMIYLCMLVLGTAIAVNTLFKYFDIQPHQWWTDVLPYLTGVPFGMMFAAKFTCDGGFRDKIMGSLDKHTILDKDDN